MSLAVVCWMWDGERKYLPQYVNALARMFAQHLTVPHRFVCITDVLEGFAPGVQVIPMPVAAAELAKMKTPEGANMPSCYRRLWLFSDEAREVIGGERVLLTDIDCVLTGNIDHLVERDESFVGWRPIMTWGNRERVAGGMYLMTLGAHTDVYTDFSKEGVAEARKAGYRGSDQAWISYKLHGKAAHWPDDAGICALSDCKGENRPDDDVRVVHFCGHLKPWHYGAPKWVKEGFGVDIERMFPPTDFRRLILKHAGKRIAVLGGAKSLAAELEGLKADVWISVNEHGAKLRPVDYVVAMDDEHATLKTNMRKHIRQWTDAPIIGPWPTNDYQLTTWPGSPRKGLSGMVATWVASVMGAHPVVLAGFDAYGGSKVNEAHRIAPSVSAEVRVAGGPLVRVWPQYQAREKFAEYEEHSSLYGLLGVDGEINVRVRKPTVIRGIAVTIGDEMRVMRHEVARLLHHGMLTEI